MTDNTDELLPCPFCGKQAMLQHWNNGYNKGHAVACIGCECRLSDMTGFSKQHMVDRWNTRHQPTPCDSELVEKVSIIIHDMSHCMSWQEAQEIGEALKPYLKGGSS